ncbi:MAG: glycoside hydrolase family 5 protein [Lentisphaerae bacterium]|jgi:endoglucanase|nr:glycoside hydrolase family 5 protein [Lentisphaerota bacterium]
MQFKIKRGTNISHWLSQSDARGELRRKKFAYEDVGRLVELGLDHLRIPVDEEQLWDDQGKPHEEAWDLLQQGLDWTLEAGLNAVIDLHILRTHHFNEGPKPLFTEESAAEAFVECWRQISDRLKDRPRDRVAYELLNEAVADDPADWNRVLHQAYNAVRELEPQRCLVLGSNLWNSVFQYEFLDVPADDRNIILTFHYYHPMPVTHYRASWTWQLKDYDGPIQYPGLAVPQAVFNTLPPEQQGRVGSMNTLGGAAVIEADLMWPLAVAARTCLPLYCGEFGVVAHAPDPIRAAWYADFLDVMTRHDIAWANWDFRGNFGLFTSDNKKTVACTSLFPQ